MSGVAYRLLIGGAQTNLAYRECLVRCEVGSRVLDVGSGDGYALLNSAEIVRSRRLRIDCVEPDAAAAARLAADARRLGLADLIRVRVESLREADNTSTASAALYDVCMCITTLICFEGNEARRRCVDMCVSHVRPGGKALFQQSVYGGMNSALLPLRYLTSWAVYELHRPLFWNDLRELFHARVWELEHIHPVAPYMLFTVWNAHQPLSSSSSERNASTSRVVRKAQP